MDRKTTKGSLSLGLIILALVLVVALLRSNGEGVANAKRRMMNVCNSYEMTDVIIELHYSGKENTETGRHPKYTCYIKGNGLERLPMNKAYTCLHAIDSIAVNGNKVSCIMTFDGDSYEFQEIGDLNGTGHILLKNGEEVYRVLPNGSEISPQDQEPVLLKK